MSTPIRKFFAMATSAALLTSSLVACGGKPQAIVMKLVDPETKAPLNIPAGKRQESKKVTEVTKNGTTETTTETVSHEVKGGEAVAGYVVEGQGATAPNVVGVAKKITGTQDLDTMEIIPVSGPSDLAVVGGFIGDVGGALGSMATGAGNVLQGIGAIKEAEKRNPLPDNLTISTQGGGVVGSGNSANTNTTSATGGSATGGAGGSATGGSSDQTQNMAQGQLQGQGQKQELQDNSKTNVKTNVDTNVDTNIKTTIKPTNENIQMSVPQTSPCNGGECGGNGHTSIEFLKGPMTPAGRAALKQFASYAVYKVA